MCRQKRNITSQQKYWCQGTSPAKRNLKPKMASILDTLFGVCLNTDKKDGKQKPKPKMASKKLPLFPPPWAMEHEDSTQFADGESSHQLQPTSITRTNSAAAIPGPKFSPTLRDVKTWDCRVPTVFFEHLRSIHIEACLWFSWLGKSPISSACLYVQAKTEYNVSTKILVPRNQPSKEKSEAKNGFNFGYTFWRLFKIQTRRTGSKNRSQKWLRKSFPYSRRHGPWNMKIPHNSQMASLHISCNRLPLPAPTARLQFPAKNFPQPYGT